jgi:hypothetical protein
MRHASIAMTFDRYEHLFVDHDNDREAMKSAASGEPTCERGFATPEGDLEALPKIILWAILGYIHADC